MERPATSRPSRRNLLRTGLLAALASASVAMPALAQDPKSGYATVDDGHRIYFEVHGSGNEGVPIVLMHGGVMAIETAFTDLIPRFASTRRVIAIEQQGHGHTADRPGPITVERLVADTVGVLDHLKVPRADLFGHSMGGMIATGLAIRHPERVRTLISLSAGYRLEGMLPELVEMNRNPNHQPSPELIPLLPTQEHFTAWQAHYDRVAPDPKALQTVLGKLHVMLVGWTGWTDEELRSIQAPTLLGFGDRDFYLLEHMTAMAGLIPGAQLAILPGTTHMNILERLDWLVSMTEARIASGR